MIAKLLASTVVFLILSCAVALQVVNVTEHPGELCNRKCVKGEQQRICYYELILELYHAMGPACGKCNQGMISDCLLPQCIIGDGYEKGVMSINRMIPGPAIQVCEGDLVVVDVKNMAPGTAASFHWHGLHMVENPFMDGVPYVTQCPIAFGSIFRYEFYARQPGTHFYYSHSGLHKLNGQYGAVIVRRPDEDNPHIDEYDHDLPEHYILFSDWKHDYAENSFPGLRKVETFPDSLLINGRGIHVDANITQRPSVLPVFYVNPGSRYKFNLIDGISLADMAQVQVQGHTMRMLTTDSYDVQPMEIDTLLMNSGERYDIVIDANRTEGDFWIRVRGAYKDPPHPIETFALLRYVTNDYDYTKPAPPYPDFNETYYIGNRLNHPQATCFINDKDYCVTDLTALDKDYELVTGKPDYKFVFSYYNKIHPVEEVFVPGKYMRFENSKGETVKNGVMNNISLILPSKPILTQHSEIDKDLFCDKSNCPENCNGESTRECIHLIKIKTNSTVEITIYDKRNIPGMDHPFHLHGHRFALMAVSNNATDLRKAIKCASNHRKCHPVWKDTVSIPRNGLAVIRFRANNPGIWMLECQYQIHSLTGMAVLLQIGEPSEWVQAPNDFPKCGHYTPEVQIDSLK